MPGLPIIQWDKLRAHVPSLKDASQEEQRVMAYWIMGFEPLDISQYASVKKENVAIIIDQFDPNGQYRSDRLLASAISKEASNTMRDMALQKSFEVAQDTILTHKHLYLLATQWRFRANTIERDNPEKAKGFRDCAEELHKVLETGVITDPKYWLEVAKMANDLGASIKAAPEKESEKPRSALDRLKGAAS